MIVLRAFLSCQSPLLLFLPNSLHPSKTHTYTHKKTPVCELRTFSSLCLLCKWLAFSGVLLAQASHAAVHMPALTAHCGPSRTRDWQFRMCCLFKVSILSPSSLCQQRNFHQCLQRKMQSWGQAAVAIRRCACAHQIVLFPQQMCLESLAPHRIA